MVQIILHKEKNVIWKRHCDWHSIDVTDLTAVARSDILLHLRSKMRCAVAKHEIKEILVPLKRYEKSQ